MTRPSLGSQQVIDPSAIISFPFKTPLRDHATKYLTFKYGTTQERSLRRLAQDEPPLLAARTKVKQGHGARMFLALWTVMLLLPEDAQGLVLEDLLMVLTYLATFVQDVIYEAEHHLFVTGMVGVACVGLVIILCCTRKRQNKFLAEISQSYRAKSDFAEMTEMSSAPAPERRLQREIEIV